MRGGGRKGAWSERAARRACGAGLALAVSFWALAALSQPEPDAPPVTIRAERSRVEIGEPFDVVIVVLRTPEQEVDLPAALPLGDAFGEIARQKTVESLPSGLVKETWVVTLVGFELGARTVPRLPVTYVSGAVTRQVETEPVSIEIVSAIGSGKEELRPIAPPVAVLRRDFRLVWIGAGTLGGLALAAALAAVLRRRRRRHVDAAVVRPDAARPPEEVALEKLVRLMDSEALEAADRRPLYFEMTEIVREYLGRRYGFDALELTSSELLEALDRTAGGFAARHDVAAWLEACDLVKYAKVPASRQEAEEALRAAVAIVERTRPPFASASTSSGRDAPPPASAEPPASAGGRETVHEPAAGEVQTRVG